jgi:hypothetical protein
MTTPIPAPLVSIELAALAPYLVQSCVVTPPAAPPLEDGIITLPAPPDISYDDLPVIGSEQIVDTSPDRVLGCANSLPEGGEQAVLNGLFPAAISGDGIIDRGTGDIWVYDGTTWNNVGPNPGPTLLEAAIIPPWNEILSYDATVRTRLQIQSLDYALALLTEPDPIGVVLGLDARRVRIVAAPALTFTLAAQTPQVSVGARVGVPALSLQLAQNAPLILTSLPAANLTLAANAPTVSAGVAVAAPPTGIALVAEPPQRAGPRPTTVSAPLAGFSVSPTAPTVATGASVSPAALALGISAVAPEAVGPPTGDPDFASVSLLLTMDGSNGSTTFTDSSNSALTITANGDAQISTAQSKFGGASALFDGSGDFLSFPAIILSSSDDCTIECWFYRIGGEGLIGGGGGTNWQLLTVLFGGLYAFWNGFPEVSGGTVINSTWHHAAVTRSSGTLRLFLDGALVATGAGSNQSIQIEKVGQVANRTDFNGYIDDVRITSGIARYTANFTPPTEPFPTS